MPNTKPLDHYFGGGVAETTMHPAVLGALFLAMLLVFVLPRKYVLVPALVAIFLLPAGESLVVLGTHWFAPRLIILAGLLRAASIKLSKGRIFVVDWLNPIDRAFIGSVISQCAAFVFLYRQTGALINQGGYLIDVLGGYFLVRLLIADDVDIQLVLRWTSLIVLIIAGCMLYEKITLHNPFGRIGGHLVPDIREGKVRAQGPFHHALTAGTFGATSLPLFFLMWRNNRARLTAAVGLLGCTLITLCSESSTTILAYVAGFLGICFWPLRNIMRQIRWGIVALLVGLQLVMNAPVWFVIGRIDLVGGSSSYHRALVVDQFLRHIGDWWLTGTQDAGSWGWDLWDVQNQYVNTGETGGMLALVLFIVMLVSAYSRVGKARRIVATKQQEWRFWFFGCALFANLVAFFGVNYSDQVKVSWFVLLAMISAATAPVLAAGTASSTALPETDPYVWQEQELADSPVELV